MGILENMQTGDKFIYSEEYFSGDYKQILYLKRALDDSTCRHKFYISVCANINNELIQQGFLYFYLDLENKISSFIGLGVNPEYRNLNIASLLIANWINLCLSNGYDFIGAHEKQRKPFLLYLLKTFGFEINDLSLYDTRNDVISICKSIYSFDNRKFLLFKDKSHEKIFKNTNVFKHDNYEILHSSVGVSVLDNVILPLQNRTVIQVKYNMIDRDLAEKKTDLILSRHKR